MAEISPEVLRDKMRKRASGNSAFRAGMHVDALRHYTEALAIATPPGTRDPLSILDAGCDAKLHANRSAVLLTLGRAEAALVDANKAVRTAAGREAGSRAADGRGWRRAPARGGAARAARAMAGPRRAFGDCAEAIRWNRP